MEVCAVGARVAPDDRSDLAFVVLRRVGVVVGLLFGLGIVALFVAHHAAAEEPARPVSRDTSAVGGLGRLTEPVTTTVADVVRPVAQLARPVTQTVAPAVQPVAQAVQPVVRAVRPVVQAVAPVIKPVYAAVAPVVQPVVAAVEPVVRPLTDAVAPVTKPVLDPVSAEPSLSPVRDKPVVGAVPDARTRPVSVDRPAFSPATVHAGPDMAPVSPGPRPAPPIVPVPFAVTGGGVAGGTGGQHGGAAAVLGGSGGVVGQWTSSERAPPGVIVGAAWFGYDDRDHPS